MSSARDEFLYRWPGGRRLMNLIELEKRVDEIIIKQIQSDIDRIDTSMMEHMKTEFENKDVSVLDKILVEIYDARILRSNSPEGATIGKMSVSSAIQKFH
jgi:hypothetical protein